MAAISYLIMEAAVKDLEEVFDPEMRGAGEFRVGLVRIGRLQDDATQYETVLLLHMGDPDNPNSWEDTWTASRQQSLTHGAVQMPMIEVGGYGPTTWWRRFTVEIQRYGIRTAEDRSTAARIAAEIKARTEYALARSLRIPGLVDDYGESASIVKPTAASMIESGGPPNSFIWRGRVRFQVLTGREY